jgi:hypothetical protein
MRCVLAGQLLDGQFPPRSESQCESPRLFRSLVAFLAALTLSCGFGSGIFAGQACAQELKPFKVHAATGDHAGKEVDFLQERKDATTVYVFINAAEWTRPAARYVKKLDEAVAAGIPEAADARLVIVWLSDDVAKGKEYLPKAQMSLQLNRSDWTVFEGEKSGPGDWNIDIASAMTTVLVKKGKETGRFPYRFVNETDVPAVVEALKK